MVKQGSFFQRLKEKWGSGSGVRVEQRSPATTPSAGASPSASAGAAPRADAGKPRPAAASSGHPADRPTVSASATPSTKPTERAAAAPAPSVERVAPPPTNGARELSSQFAPVDTRSSRKLSDREEALLALGTHFQELSTMLRGSHARMDDQLTKLVTATSALGALPALSQQQLDTLKAVSAHMEKQNALGEQMATSLQTLQSLPTLL